MKKEYMMYRIVSNGELFEAQGLKDFDDLYRRWVKLPKGPNSLVNPSANISTSECLIDWYQRYYADGWEVVKTYEA